VIVKNFFLFLFLKITFILRDKSPSYIPPSLSLSVFLSFSFYCRPIAKIRERKKQTNKQRRINIAVRNYRFFLCSYDHTFNFRSTDVPRS